MDNYCAYTQAVYALFMEKSLGVEICSTNNDLVSLTRQLFIEEYKELFNRDKDLVCSETTLYS